METNESIRVSNYKSRFNQSMDHFSTKYPYALEVPDSLSYLPRETIFSNRIISAFNWSYLDNLVYNHGVHDSYGLVSALKFWRSRFLLLPACGTTKQLWEQLKESKLLGKQIDCDIYNLNASVINNCEQLWEKFVCFMTFVNGIRRLPIVHKSKQSAEKSEIPRTRHDSASAMVTQSSNTNIPNSSLLSRIKGTMSNSGSGNPPTPVATSQSDVTGSASELSNFDSVIESVPPTLQRTTADLPGVVFPVPSSLGSSALLLSTPLQTSQLKLSSKSEFGRVIHTIMDPELGIPFVSEAVAFPKYTFYASDLTIWLQNNLVDILSIKSAIEYAQRLLEAKFICHTSGNPKHNFIHGIFFYTILVDLPPFNSNTSESQDISSSKNSQLSVNKSNSSNQGCSSSGSSSVSFNPQQLNNNNIVTSRRSTGISSEPSPVVAPNQSYYQTIQPHPFPINYLPKSEHLLGSFDTNFQNEWLEVAIVGPDRSKSLSPNECLTSEASCDKIHAFDWERASPSPSSHCPAVVKSPSVLAFEGILSLFQVSELFGTEKNANIHVGSEGVLRKRITRDLLVSSTHKDTVEWYCLLHDMNYDPGCAFALELQWLVASGSRIFTYFLSIYRRANYYGFHFVPSPCYPFGYPGPRIISDPLRMPIFVPCNLSALVNVQKSVNNDTPQITAFEYANKLFPELSDVDQESALYYFQLLILTRFGFIPITHSPAIRRVGESNYATVDKPTIQKVESSTSTTKTLFPSGMLHTQRVYVHCSGGMFVKIPVYGRQVHKDCQEPSMGVVESVSDTNRSILTQKPLNSVENETSEIIQSPVSFETVLGSHKNECNSSTFPVSGEKPFAKDEEFSTCQHPQTSCFEIQTEVGFFWTWNHMLPRRWRGQMTGDEAFQDGMLEDFRRFCSATDTRLCNLFNNYKANKLF